MKNKDPNYVVKLEKAIAEKYGEEAIQNPKSKQLKTSNFFQTFF